ncbi:DUF3097 family protein [Acaricomes phytoseiuli]|uniref:DUF3097 domain-containing protein n=1 Tax=Acaricomes phytoseiuli TaxID=291968 RepID=UPI000365319F
MSNPPNHSASTASPWGPQDLRALRQQRQKPRTAQLSASAGIVVEEVQSGWVGAVLRTERSGGMHIVVLEDRLGKVRSFPLGFGFLFEGEPVELVAAASTTPSTSATSAGSAQRTASGSVKVHGQRARVAKASRIWVEGKHDAELVEKVWGDDLRIEGIVVEPLGGIDDLPAVVTEFGPGPERRLAILVDHLVPGSKENRIAQETMRLPGSVGNVLIVGHPYVDVWQAIRPQVLGIPSWPEIPRSMPWKIGIMQAFGWPHAGPADLAQGWQRLLSSVQSYADLEPSLLGRVEEMIDFLTAGVS